MGLKRKGGTANQSVQRLRGYCTDAFAQDELDAGARHLSKLIRTLPAERFPDNIQQVLYACADVLATDGSQATGNGDPCALHLNVGLRV
jgi:hypothetical protein